MAEVTIDSIMQQIAQLPLVEQQKLSRALWAQTGRAKPPLDKRVPATPMPDEAPIRQWMIEHRHEYVGQWIALDGDRLIAHGTNHREVFAAAKADGAYLPLITFIEDPNVAWVNV
jgi:hypothetical protein